MDKDEALNLPAILKRHEAATVLVDDEVLRLVTRYSPAATTTILALVSDVPLLVAALAEAQGRLERMETELPFIEATLIQWSEDTEEYGSFAWQYRDRVDAALDALARIVKEGNDG